MTTKLQKNGGILCRIDILFPHIVAYHSVILKSILLISEIISDNTLSVL